jgi:hypothetical protein
VGTLEGKRPLGSLRNRRNINKIDLREIGWGSMDAIINLGFLE